ncbi:MAG: mechanosensitive ion channel domain-containing protein [Candidatus Woesearchaeota archaeon]
MHSSKIKILADLAGDVKHKLKHKGANYAIIVFGIFLLVSIAAIYLHNSSLIVLPIFVIGPLKVLTLIFASYFVASIITRVTIAIVVNAFGDKIEVEHKLLITKLYTGIIYLFATIYILWRLGVGLQNITLIAGFIATGLAFAVRDVIMSFLAWYILLTKRPFRIGDHIKIGDDEGKVMHIGTFYVLIDNSPNTKEDFVRIPNRVFLEKPVQNYGPSDVLHVVKFYVSKIPKDYELKISKIKASLKKNLKIDVSAYLDYDQDKRFIKFEFRTDYDRKSEIKSRILLIASREF